MADRPGDGDSAISIGSIGAAELRSSDSLLRSARTTRITYLPQSVGSIPIVRLRFVRRPQPHARGYPGSASSEQRWQSS